ncbi:MAG TPA: hypothetical protein VK206_05030, partial [Anaerolineales bacterium]|nr:hypothetical protein [Anaerolineales bacterium]
RGALQVVLFKFFLRSGLGIYILQIIDKQPRKYNLSLISSWGTGLDVKSKEVSVEGTLTTNQVDKYTVALPDGNIQKLINSITVFISNYDGGSSRIQN